jgi:Galactosyltransferase
VKRQPTSMHRKSCTSITGDSRAFLDRPMMTTSMSTLTSTTIPQQQQQQQQLCRLRRRGQNSNNRRRPIVIVGFVVLAFVYLFQFALIIHQNEASLQLASDVADASIIAQKNSAVLGKDRPSSSSINSINSEHIKEDTTVATTDNISSNGGSSKHNESKGKRRRQYTTNRILIGILSDSHTDMARIYRERHRQLFQLWDDPRLCSIGELLSVMESTNNSDRNNIGDGEKDTRCQVTYTFVLGAYTRLNKNVTTQIDHEGRTISTIHLGSLQDTITAGTTNSSSVLNQSPLTLSHMPVWQEQYKDVYEKHHNDVTILNIIENMNEGKTTTYLNWAYQVAERYNISYVAKCDSDTLLRFSTLLNVLNDELPPVESSLSQQPPVLLGALRHKAFWPDVEEKEWYWKKEWHNGMHLYLSGEMYVMSTNLARVAVDEAKRGMALRSQSQQQQEQQQLLPSIEYTVGHEDHDAISMVQVGHYNATSSTPISSSSLPPPIRWIIVPKQARFFEHPVKGNYRWERIWKREQRLHNQSVALRLSSNMTHVPSSATTTAITTTTAKPNRRKSLLVILGTRTREQRQNYRIMMDKQGYRICNPLKTDDTTPFIKYEDCDIFQLFVVGVGDNRSQKTRFENIDDYDNLVLHHDAGNDDNNHDDDDVIMLNITDNIHLGMGQTVLYYISETWLKRQDTTTQNQQVHLDFILFCQFKFQVHLKDWFQNIANPTIIPTMYDGHHGDDQGVGHRMFIGEFRDKDQTPREFGSYRQKGPNDTHFFHDNYENILLYMGSEVLAISSELVPVILDRARDTDETSRLGIARNLGHDLTYFASKADQTIIHWISITKSVRFWSPIP